MIRSAATPGLCGRVATTLLLALVRLYQAVSRFTPARCRFHPTCSAYAAQALRRHGAARGTALAARRLARCHPWNPGGVDHVPATSPATETQGASA